MDHPKTPESGYENPEYYAEDARNPMTEEDFLLLLKPPDASTQNTEDDYSFLEELPWEEINSADTPETSEENRKRQSSNEEDIRTETDAYKESKPEVYGTNDQVTFDFSESSYINPDSQTKEMTISSQIPLDSESQACQEFLSNEESDHKRQEVDDLSKEENSSIGQCTTYKKNIFQKENVTSEIKDTDIFKATSVCSVDDRLAVPGTSHSLEDNSHSELSVEKVKIVPPIKQQPKVETEQKQTGDTTTQTTEEESISQEPTRDSSTKTSLLEQPPATAEPPEEGRKRKISNAQNRHGSNIYKLPKRETAQKQRRCSVCKTTMSEHAEVHDGQVMYKCCRCIFKIGNFNYLHMHIYDDHSKPFYCNVCQMKYSKKGSHDYGGTCDLCMQNFKCRFEFEEHHSYFSKSFFNCNT